MQSNHFIGLSYEFSLVHQIAPHGLVGVMEEGRDTVALTLVILLA